MKLNKVLFGMSLAVSSCCALAAKPAPVIEVGASSGGLAEQLAVLDRKLDSRNKAQIAIQQQLDELQNEVNELRGVTELHTHQLSQVLERQRELYQELDRRVSQALQPTSKAPGATALPPDSGLNVAYSSDLSENEFYDRAVNLVLKDKRYEQAITEFNAFNNKFPNSAYAANAHYWLGQLLFNKDELAKAEHEFTLVVNQYKDSTKRSDAMLKLALVAQKLNQAQRAGNLYRQVIEEYPTSSAAQLAKARLESLGQ